MKHCLWILLLALSACATAPAPKPTEPDNDRPDRLTPGQAYERALELRDSNRLSRARLFLQSAGQRGHAGAQFELGLWYLTGRDGVVDDSHAAIWLHLAAQQLQPDALRYVWQLHLFGRGVEKNPDLARQWLETGARSGDAALQYRLGVWLAEGYTGQPDKPAASHWLVRAAQGGVVEACYRAGLMLLEGDGIEADEILAVELLQRGANHGHAPCMLLLGDCHRDGRGIARDHTQAVDWYRKVARQRGDPDVALAAKRRLAELGE